MHSHPPQVIRIAAHRVRSFGAASVAELVSAALQQGICLSGAQARESLASAEPRFLDDDWFWLPSRRRDRLSTLSRRILAVASPLHLATLRVGVCRAHRRRLAALIPPVSVLQAFYDTHPDFVLDTRDCVRARAPLDYRVELGKTDRLFVEVLRSSWTGVLDRASFCEACVAGGMSKQTFNSAATYSPVLDHPAPDAWCLRGTRFSPVIVAALRYAKGVQPRRRDDRG